MPREIWQLLWGAFVVWCVAVAIKAAQALRRDETYVFSMWDGGALRVGKKLGRSGTWVKLAAMLLIAACVAALLSGALPYRIAFPSVIVVAIAGIACDFALALKE